MLYPAELRAHCGIHLTKAPVTQGLNAKPGLFPSLLNHIFTFPAHFMLDLWAVEK